MGGNRLELKNFSEKLLEFKIKQKNHSIKKIIGKSVKNKQMSKKIR